MKIILLIILVMLLSGCSQYKEPRPKTKTSREICEEQGGIPIPSVWTGSLKRCDFK